MCSLMTSSPYEAVGLNNSLHKMKHCSASLKHYAYGTLYCIRTIQCGLIKIETGLISCDNC